MDTEIIVALISGIFAFLGSVVAVSMSQSKTMYRIEQLEQKMDKHNSVIERVFKLEQKVEDISNDINN